MGPSDELFQRTRSSLLMRLRESSDRPAWNSAWDAFFSQYSPMVLAWCRRWNLQADDAEEVASAVMLCLGRRMESFDYDPARRFRSWLRTVVENEIRGFLRRRASRRADTASGTDDAHDLLVSLHDPGTAADELAGVLDEQRSLLRQALLETEQRVRAETWTAFYRTAIEEQDAASIAQHLGMSVVAVYKARSRVQEMLRQRVDELRRSEQADS